MGRRYQFHRAGNLTMHRDTMRTIIEARKAEAIRDRRARRIAGVVLVLLLIVGSATLQPPII